MQRSEEENISFSKYITLHALGVDSFVKLRSSNMEHICISKFIPPN